MDAAIHDVLAGLITALLAGYGLTALYQLLRRSRPGLAIGLPLLVAFGLRLVAAAGIALTPLERTLRGGDEIFFLGQADRIATSPFGSDAWLDSLTGALYNAVMATQIWLFGSPEFVLRIGQTGIAVAGLLLLAVAVYELAGPRAAAVAMWFLAVEPANVFFSSILHKEPLMMLAAGLVAFGGAMLWKRPDPRWLVPGVFGCLIAVATRPYAGWFLIAAGAAIMLHAGIRARRSSAVRGLGLIALVVLLAAVTAPIVLEASTDESLHALQGSQDANTSDDSNLGLEQVDFSTRGAVITNLPGRIADLLTRPYPWQVQNLSQQFGVLGTLVALVVVFLLGRESFRRRSEMMGRVGPLLYVALGLLVAYSLSSGNAGTAFRYRMHIVAVAACAYVGMRWFWARDPLALPGVRTSRPRSTKAPG